MAGTVFSAHIEISFHCWEEVIQSQNKEVASVRNVRNVGSSDSLVPMKRNFNQMHVPVQARPQRSAALTDFINTQTHNASYARPTRVLHASYMRPTPGPRPKNTFGQAWPSIWSSPARTRAGVFAGRPCSDGSM